MGEQGGSKPPAFVPSIFGVRPFSSWIYPLIKPFVRLQKKKYKYAISPKLPPFPSLIRTTISRSLISLLMHPSRSVLSLAPRRPAVLPPTPGPHQGDEKKTDVSITSTFIRANQWIVGWVKLIPLELCSWWKHVNVKIKLNGRRVSWFLGD